MVGFWKMGGRRPVKTNDFIWPGRSRRLDDPQKRTVAEYVPTRWCINNHIVGATTNEQARRRPLVFEWNLDLLFIVNEKEKGVVWGNDIVFEDSFAFGFSLSHFSCFFFRKRRNKRNQTEREKRRKASLAVRKSDSTGFAGLRRLVIPYPFATKNNVVQTSFSLWFC